MAYRYPASATGKSLLTSTPSSGRAVLGAFPVGNVTSVKTAAYTAAPDDIVRCDPSANGFTVYLPSAPPDGTVVTVKRVDTDSSNAVLVQRGGTDTFNVAETGPSVMQLVLPSQTAVLRYGSGVWTVIGNSYGPASLETLYTPRNISVLFDPLGRKMVEFSQTPGGDGLPSVVTWLGVENNVNYANGSPGTVTLTTNNPGDGYSSSVPLRLAPKGGQVQLYGSFPSIAAESANSDASIYLYPKGATSVYVGPNIGGTRPNYLELRPGATGGDARILTGSTVDANVGINLVTKGTGTVKANGTALELTSNKGVANGYASLDSSAKLTSSQVPDTLTSKTLSSPTITGTLTATMIPDAGYHNLQKYVNTPLNHTHGATFAGLNPMIYNDLAFNLRRGGSVSVTKNGTTLTDGVDYTGSSFFGMGQFTTISGLSNSDTVVITVTPHTLVNLLRFQTWFGILMDVGGIAKNVTIEAYHNSAWNTVYSSADTSYLMGYHAKFYTANGSSDITEIRYTLTNFTTSFVRVSSLFAVNFFTTYASGAFLNRGGGAVYGTTAAPFALTATGSDANISINLVPKGTGRVQANGVEVVTTTDSQTLTGKTLTTPRINQVNDTTNNTQVVSYTGVASAVNFIRFDNAATGGHPYIRARGGDSDVSLNLMALGAGGVFLRDGAGSSIAEFSPGTGTTVNRWVFKNSSTGNSVIASASGSDSNISLSLSPKGAGSVQIPSTASGLEFYNTADQTNYERARAYWTSNVFTLTTENGGAGTLRSISLTNTLGIVRCTSNAAGRVDLNTGNSGFVTTGVTTSGTLSASSGTQVMLGVVPVMSQTNTGGYTALLVNPTETNNTGSGTKLLADFQVGGVSRARIDNTGLLTANNFVSTKTATTTAAGTTTLTVASSRTQEFTGSTTQTVTLPTTSITAGADYRIINNSSGAVTVQSSGGNTVATVAAGTLQLFIAQVDTPTTAAHWRAI